MTSVDKNVEKREPLYTAGGSAASVHFLKISQEIKHRITIWHSTSTPVCIPKRNENTCPHKNLCTSAQAALFNTVKKWKQAK